MPRDQPPVDVFEQDVSLPHQFLIDLFIDSQIRLVCLQSTHGCLKQTPERWRVVPSLYQHSADRHSSSRRLMVPGCLLLSWQTFLRNEVAPLRSLLKLQFRTEFPRQSTPNNVFNQACAAYWGVDGSAGHWGPFSVWLDGTFTAARGSRSHVDPHGDISNSSNFLLSLAWNAGCKMDDEASLPPDEQQWSQYKPV